MKLVKLIIFIYSLPFLIPHTDGKYFSRIKIYLKSFNINLKITISLKKSLKIWKFHQTCMIYISIYVKFPSLEMAGWTGVITSERIEQFSETLSKILRNRVVKFADTERPFTFTRQRNRDTACYSPRLRFKSNYIFCIRKIIFFAVRWFGVFDISS